MPILHFPPDLTVGTLSWPGYWEPERGPILAKGDVEVAPDVEIDLAVHHIESVSRVGDGWEMKGSNMPVDLAFLLDLPPDSIESLHLMPPIVNASVRFISHLAPGLRKLYLGRTRLTDEALPSVASLAGLTWLQTWGNAFTDDGVQQLAALASLEDLYLEEETLTAAALGFACQLPHLRRLGLQDMPITPEQLRQLQSTMPTVQIG